MPSPELERIIKSYPANISASVIAREHGYNASYIRSIRRLMKREDTPPAQTILEIIGEKFPPVSGLNIILHVVHRYHHYRAAEILSRITGKIISEQAIRYHTSRFGKSRKPFNPREATFEMIEKKIDLYPRLRQSLGTHHD